MKFVMFICLFSIISACEAGATLVKAKVYDLEGDVSKPLFVFERREKIEDGKKVVYSEYRDMTGHLAMAEVMTYRNLNGGLEYAPFENYTFDRPQSGEKASVAIKGEKLVFDHEKNGKRNQNEEDVEPNLISRDQIVAFCQKNWDTLMKGDKVKARFILPDRAETVGFGIKKEADTQLNGKDAVRLVMKPTSMIIALIAKDVFFTFDKGEGHLLLRIEGRTPVMKKVGDAMKNIQGRIDFEYVEDQKSSAKGSS